MFARYNKTKHFIAPTTQWRGVVMGLGLAAMGMALYQLLLTLANRGPIPGCISLGLVDCQAVSESPWSYWLWVPVALPGALVYGVFAVLIWHTRAGAPPRREGRVWRWLMVVALLMFGAAMWFLGLSVLYMEHLCFTCLMTHGLATAAAAAAVMGAPLRLKPTRSQRPDPVKIRLNGGIVIALLGSAMLLTLVGGQVLMPSGPENGRRLAANGGSAGLDPGDVDQEVSAAGLPRVDPANPATFIAPGITADPAWQAMDPVAARAAPSTSGGAGGSGGTTRLPANGPALSEPATQPADHALDDADDRWPRFPAQGQRSTMSRYLGGRLFVDPRQYPAMGSASAPTHLLFVLDYGAPESRAMDDLVRRIIQRYGAQVCITVIGVPRQTGEDATPLELAAATRATQLARLAWAVWKTDPPELRSFHNWLWRQEEVEPTYEQAMMAAGALVDQAKLSQALSDPALEPALREHAEILAACPAGAMPKLVFGHAVAQGIPKSPEVMFKFLEERLYLRPMSTAP
ncbi:MAG: vitamin K epoxide reductase family protein [Phycisphaeraceae bacterium]